MAGMRLQVVGGNAAINGSFIYRTTEGPLYATEAASKRSATTLKITQRSSGVLGPVDAPHLRCVLQGPSGKGEYQLELGPEPQEQDSMMIGGTTVEQGWKLLQDHGRTLLRNDVDAATSTWIAVPDEAGTTWSFWWYSPNAANMEDFDRYIVVDLEVVA